jgi:hypothetical protein
MTELSSFSDSAAFANSWNVLFLVVYSSWFAELFDVVGKEGRPRQFCKEGTETGLAKPGLIGAEPG